MAEHDFRYNLLNPEHTLIECRAPVSYTHLTLPTKA